MARGAELWDHFIKNIEGDRRQRLTVILGKGKEAQDLSAIADRGWFEVQWDETYDVFDDLYSGSNFEVRGGLLGEGTLAVEDGELYFLTEQGRTGIGKDEAKGFHLGSADEVDLSSSDDVKRFLGEKLGLENYQDFRSEEVAEGQDKFVTDRNRGLAAQADPASAGYNTLIQSAFTNINDILQFQSDAAGAPSTIQTLYLDRQAQTYLPSSIRDRGVAGALGGGGS